VDAVWNDYASKFSTTGPHRLSERLQKRLDLFVELAVFLAQVLDLIYRVQDSCMVLVTEFPADLGK